MAETTRQVWQSHERRVYFKVGAMKGRIEVCFKYFPQENIIYYVIYEDLQDLICCCMIHASRSDGQLAKWYVPPAKLITDDLASLSELRSFLSAASRAEKSSATNGTRTLNSSQKT